MVQGGQELRGHGSGTAMGDSMGLYPPAPCGPPGCEEYFSKFVGWHVCSLCILKSVVFVVLTVMLFGSL